MKKLIFNNKYILFTLLLSLVLFVACYDFASYPKSLYPVFEQAGTNQSELKKVIRHYSRQASDSLKLKAAVFLIENMDAHYSYQSPQWELCQKELDSLFKHQKDYSKLKPAFDTIYSRYDFTDVSYISDLHTVSADFLIQNIEDAFTAWKFPFARQLSFDEFCEYILPYRAGKEPLCNWRREFDTNYIPDLKQKLAPPKNTTPFRMPEQNKGNWIAEYKLKPANYIIPATDKYTFFTNRSAITICNALKNPAGTMMFLPGNLPDYNSHSLSILRLGSCRHYSLQAILAARRLGIPVVQDFTPQWATRAYNHDWNVLIDKNSTKPLTFGFGDYVELGKHIEVVSDRIAPKIYRSTFAKQPTSLYMIRGKEDIPSTLASPCIKDVTNEYYKTTDVPVTFLNTPPASLKFAYLSVFDNKDWIPVAWSRLQKNKTVFHNLNRNIVCLPTYYYNKKIFPAAYPIALRTNGDVNILKPDLKKTETIVLNRKYQARMSEWISPLIIGGKFQLSNDSTFSTHTDVYEIKDTTEAFFYIVKTHTKRKYKYLRYIFPNNPNCGMSEIEAYEPNSSVKLTGRIMSKKDAFNEKQYENAFDGDETTQSQPTQQDEAWIGIAFDKPRQIDRITYLRRNDGNCVCHGQLYELFYWDNKWVSLGQQTGSNETYRLTYHNVPTNALFLLRNLTKGKEERIFTYEQGRQVWW